MRRLERRMLLLEKQGQLMRRGAFQLPRCIIEKPPDAAVNAGPLGTERSYLAGELHGSKN